MKQVSETDSLQNRKNPGALFREIAEKIGKFLDHQMSTLNYYRERYNTTSNLGHGYPLCERMKYK